MQRVVESTFFNIFGPNFEITSNKMYDTLMPVRVTVDNPESQSGINVFAKSDTLADVW